MNFIAYVIQTKTFTIEDVQKAFSCTYLEARESVRALEEKDVVALGSGFEFHLTPNGENLYKKPVLPEAQKGLLEATRSQFLSIKELVSGSFNFFRKYAISDDDPDWQWMVQNRLIDAKGHILLDEEKIGALLRYLSLRYEDGDEDFDDED